MTAPRDPDRLIAAFLEDGTDDLPDWAFDEVRHDIHRTRQRVVIGPWREPIMSNLARYGVIAAAVVLLVGAGAVLLRPAPAGVGAPASVAPAATPSPTASDVAAASPTLAPNALPPGPVHDQRTCGSVPGAERHHPGGRVRLDRSMRRHSGRTTVPPVTRRSRDRRLAGHHRDVCRPVHRPHAQGARTRGRGGPHRRARQPARDLLGPATDVTVSGYSGQYVDTTVTADITKCGNGVDGFWLWAAAEAPPLRPEHRRAQPDLCVRRRRHALHVRRPPASRPPPTPTGPRSCRCWKPCRSSQRPRRPPPDDNGRRRPAGVAHNATVRMVRCPSNHPLLVALRDDPEAASVERAQHVEVAVVERRDVARPVSRREDDDRRVRHAARQLISRRAPAARSPGRLRARASSASSRGRRAPRTP